MPFPFPFPLVSLCVSSGVPFPFPLLELLQLLGTPLPLSVWICLKSFPLVWKSCSAVLLRLLLLLLLSPTPWELFMLSAADCLLGMLWLENVKTGLERLCCSCCHVATPPLPGRKQDARAAVKQIDSEVACLIPDWGQCSLACYTERMCVR